MNSSSTSFGFGDAIGERNCLALNFNEMEGFVDGAAEALNSFEDVVAIVNRGMRFEQPSCSSDIKIFILPFVNSNEAVVLDKNVMAVFVDFVECGCCFDGMRETSEKVVGTLEKFVDVALIHIVVTVGERIKSGIITTVVITKDSSRTVVSNSKHDFAMDVSSSEVFIFSTELKLET